MDEDDDCHGCGATLADRERHKASAPDANISTALSVCPHCGAGKCAMCDMGDDVACGNCPDEGD